MIIHLQFGFSQFISFREDLWNFSQSEHIIGPGSHVEYPTGYIYIVYIKVYKIDFVDIKYTDETIST
jgi:hypothetical protein